MDSIFSIPDMARRKPEFMESDMEKSINESINTMLDSNYKCNKQNNNILFNINKLNQDSRYEMKKTVLYQIGLKLKNNQAKNNLLIREMRKIMAANEDFSIDSVE